MQLLIATQNKTKVDRVSSILNSFDSSLELLSLNSFDIPEPDEPYDTFAENAFHKADYYCKITKLATLSEDSGLCINALNGFPGVRTKEFRVAAGNIEEACKELQFKLKNQADHSAYFISAACIILPNNKVLTAEGRLNGSISSVPFKDQGFDFERIFVPAGHSQTLAELTEYHKNNNTHRYQAIKSLHEQLIKEPNI